MDSKKKIMEFVKEFILMAITFSIVGIIIFKLFDMNFSIANVVGFMIGWSLIKIFIDSKRKNSQD